MNKKTIVVAVALVAQVVAISWLIWRYERVVSQGVEVRFACQAYDPYDPLRGRYLQARVVEDCTNITFAVETNGYWMGSRADLAVRIEPTSNIDRWRVVEVAEAPTEDGIWLEGLKVRFDYRTRWTDRQKGESYEAFEKRRKASGVIARVEFPDQLFLNEKLAPEAEKVLRKAAGKSAIAVYRVYKGEIVITDIEIGGKSVVEVAGAEVRAVEK